LNTPLCTSFNCHYNGNGRRRTTNNKGGYVNALRQVQIQREWLGYEEARRLVGLSRTTLYRLANTGEIKGARIGRSVRINRVSLEEYMERWVTSGNED
jgi:excisionase family DNA binding protein